MDSVSDNVIKFPKPELDIELVLEEVIKDEELVHAVQTALLIYCNGLTASTDADWHHVFDACINMTVMAGLNMGMELEDVEILFNEMEIERVEYDA